MKNHKEDKIYLSVVVPVFNEEENLEKLVKELTNVLKDLSINYEIIFINDGSTDSSWEILKKIKSLYPEVRIYNFARNYGQHTAIFAGFELARGEIILTIDADLQNPPEEIPRFIKKIEEGYDSVGGWRKNRHDPIFRKIVSKLGNIVLNKITGIKLNDYGCMLRAYRKDVVRRIIELNEFSSFFIPALAYRYSKNPTEIPVVHRERERGASKYNALTLLKLNFDILTNSSLLPLQLITLLGILISIFGFVSTSIITILAIASKTFKMIHIIVSLLFLFLGIETILIGLIGEYVGRIYYEVRGKPRYVISHTDIFGNGKRLEREK
ncbi:MAG: glycosyltransferase [Candidatus Schekmanbacteria bacterium]|nr:MAG: glycosyltransferase [Candidatus Schekmanbacteria bacterium]